MAQAEAAYSSCGYIFACGATSLAGALAGQNSNINIAPDGSSLAIDVYQTSSAYGYSESGISVDASYQNAFEVSFYLENPLEYSFFADFDFAYGIASITLNKFDIYGQIIGSVFSYDSSWYGTDTGQLEGESFYTFTTYSSGTNDLESMNLSLLIGNGGSQSVHEPSTLLLFGTGLVGLAGLRKRFKR